MAEAKEEALYKERLSGEYWKALEDAKRFHAFTDKFSGKFIRPHARHLKGIIDKYDIKSILDYGCGKGRQYTWVIPNAKIEQWADEDDKVIPHGKTIEEYWGVNVTKFDPAVPEFSQEPGGPHDLTIVSHVLGTIPENDLPIIIERIFQLTNKYLYVVESIGRPKKNWTSVGDTQIVRNTMDWIDLIAPLKPPHIRCELVVRYRSKLGSHLGRFKL